MTRNTTLTWRLSTASLSLLAAIAVYCFARLSPPELLEPLQATSTLLAAQSGFFGSAPSIFYTLSIGLFFGACAMTQTSARLHCLIWIGLTLCLELSQHSMVAGPLAALLADTLSGSTWELVGPYWIRGVFDPLDLLATIVGGWIALSVLTYFPTEINNETDR